MIGFLIGSWKSSRTPVEGGNGPAIANHLKQQQANMLGMTKQETPILPVEDPAEFFGLRSAH